jgi:CRP-like cAMP-binding protein
MAQQRQSQDRGSREAIADALRSVFPRASATSIAALLEAHALRVAEPGLSQPSRSAEPEMNLVLDGHVAVVQSAPDGRVAFLGVWGRGTLVGILTLNGEADTVATEVLDSALFANWRAERFREIARRDPGMMLDVVDLLVYAVRLSLLLLEQQRFATASARLASFLLRHEDLVFSGRRPRILRSQLAAAAGVSREMSGRILRRWERDEIIRRIGKTRLVLVDRQRLVLEAAGAEALAPMPRRPTEIAS